MRAAGTEGRNETPLIPGILLAAGTSSRFKRAKLLESWRGEPLLRHAARTLADAGLHPVIVVLPASAAFHDALNGLDVVKVENAEPARGMSHSITLAIQALPADAPAALIAVADQPLLSVELVGKLVSAFRPGLILAPRYGTHPGNPRLFDRRFFDELSALSGDTGGQVIAQRHPELVLEIDLPERLGIDIDRPSDLERLRRREVDSED